jgi:hypothetical protein
MSKNNFFLQVRISHILHFISICDLFTDSSSYKCFFFSLLCFGHDLQCNDNCNVCTSLQNSRGLDSPIMQTGSALEFLSLILSPCEFPVLRDLDRVMDWPAAT